MKKILFILLGIMFVGCNTTTLSEGAKITVSPASFTIAGGSGSTYVTFVVTATNEDGVPIDNVEINANLLFLRMLDSDGNYTTDGSATFTTDKEGEAKIILEIPMGTTLEETLSLDSGGAATATATITVSPE